MGCGQSMHQRSSEERDMAAVDGHSVASVPPNNQQQAVPAVAARDASKGSADAAATTSSDGKKKKKFVTVFSRGAVYSPPPPPRHPRRPSQTASFKPVDSLSPLERSPVVQAFPSAAVNGAIGATPSGVPSPVAASAAASVPLPAVFRLEGDDKTPTSSRSAATSNKHHHKREKLLYFNSLEDLSGSSLVALSSFNNTSAFKNLPHTSPGSRSARSGKSRSTSTSNSNHSEAQVSYHPALHNESMPINLPSFQQLLIPGALGGAKPPSSSSASPRHSSPFPRVLDDSDAPYVLSVVSNSTSSCGQAKSAGALSSNQD